MRQLLDTLDLLVQTAPIIIAIDGPSASGKTTFAQRLLKRYQDAQVFHMDDFFLPPAFRTAQRLETPGGNVYYERFLQEVLQPLMLREAFTYQAYDCVTGGLTPKNASPAQLSIVEGAYSLHPALRDYYDLKIFLEVDEEAQAKRIVQRNGLEAAQRFFNHWIPLENKYFDGLSIREAADVILSQQA